MANMPDTRDSLIAQVQNPANREAWEQFTAIYRPVVYRLARTRGLQDADAEDLAQQVLLAIARAIPDWQRNNSQTRFRHWLNRIAKNVILNALTRGAKEPAVGGSGFMNLLRGVTQPDDIESQIELEYRRQVYRQAAEIVRDAVQGHTWSIFVMTIIEGQSTEIVANKMQTTIGNVHAIRSRIMRRLQDAVKDIQEADE
ncbi:MAG: sigma-70 family RNA polymerase sigma factor [Planctomycetota bacterium]|nr:sigma-70 family RNA polymerase sigma factor [Planctomycetota bacterium]